MDGHMGRLDDGWVVGWVGGMVGKAQRDEAMNGLEDKGRMARWLLLVGVWFAFRESVTWSEPGVCAMAAERDFLGTGDGGRGGVKR